jgi:hypothetical protein
VALGMEPRALHTLGECSTTGLHPQHIKIYAYMYLHITCIYACYIEKEKGMVAHGCNPSTQEAEAVGSRVPGQLSLHSET